MEIHNYYDDFGNPFGGYAKNKSIGINIKWQDGPIKENGINGALIEDLLEIIIKRL